MQFWKQVAVIAIGGVLALTLFLLGLTVLGLIQNRREARRMSGHHV